MKKFITGCIVLYKNDELQLKKLLRSFSNCELDVHIFLIDNSPTDKLKIFANKSNITYIYNPSNPGFGSAHNIAIKMAVKQGSEYHCIINPDIFFDEDVIGPMVNYMKHDDTIGMLMPQILNIDGSIQTLPKLLPSPFSILMRKLKWPPLFFKEFINIYELREVPSEQIYNSPVLSGCFTLLNLKVIEEIGMYDDQFFMYFEDWDLSRRIHRKFKTIYFPLVSVYHGYESGANKSFKLFIIFLKSTFKYFSKWGWFFDLERKKINSSALAQLKK